MKRRVRVKPGKTQSMMGMIVGILFCVLGLVVVVPTFGFFGLIWTAMALVITITNGMNAFSDKGVASHEILVDEYDEIHEDGGYNGSEYYADGTRRPKKSAEDPVDSVKERLATAKKLYDDGLITKEEYEEKRRQLIDQI